MKRYIIHTSDSTWGNAAEITCWHTQGNGWKTIGYHYVILNGWIANGVFDEYFDGHLETGRSPESGGAHTRGQNDAIGICLIGMSGLHTNRQYEELKRFLDMERDKYGEIEVTQHSQWDDKKEHCAGINIEDFR